MINNKLSQYWIEENHPENGMFRVYWKDVENAWTGGATLDPDEGEGLRYEWEYKDGKPTDGISKGWYSNGNLRNTKTYKDGKENGLRTDWYPDGQKSDEGNYKDGIIHGKWIEWHENGEKCVEGNFVDGKKEGIFTYWWEDGLPKWEIHFKDGEKVLQKPLSPPQ